MPLSEPSVPGNRRTISSLQNDAVKLIRSLEMRKARRQTGLFVAEGASLLLTARDNGWSPRTLVTGPDAQANQASSALAEWAAVADADHLDVTAAVLEKLAAKDNPQSVMAVFEQRWSPLPAPAQTGTAGTEMPPLWIALEEPRDPGNLGTILRTADAAGASGIILVGQACDPFSREAVRASMGSIFAVPVAHCERNTFLDLARHWGGDVVGTHLGGKIDYRNAAYRDPVLLIMGNEGAGLSDEVASVCGKLVRIPMAGRLDSLNLAVSTALMLFELRRSRLKL